MSYNGVSGICYCASWVLFGAPRHPSHYDPLHASPFYSKGPSEDWGQQTPHATHQMMWHLRAMSKDHQSYEASKLRMLHTRRCGTPGFFQKTIRVMGPSSSSFYTPDDAPPPPFHPQSTSHSTLNIPQENLVSSPLNSTPQHFPSVTAPIHLQLMSDPPQLTQDPTSSGTGPAHWQDPHGGCPTGTGPSPERPSLPP